MTQPTTITDIAAAANPERIIRPCVGCEVFAYDPVQCAACYAALYPRLDPPIHCECREAGSVVLCGNCGL